MENDNELVSQVLDLGVHRTGEITETYLGAIGTGIKQMIAWTFGENIFFPSKIKGTRREVDSFTSALSGERRYMQAYKRHGLNDPRTYDSKYLLDDAIRNFERTTKLKWPFK